MFRGCFVLLDTTVGTVNFKMKIAA
jgi:hypothetical protein